MSGLVVPPNAELLVSTFLRMDPDVQAIFGDEVYTELPVGHDTWPAARITRAGGAPAFAEPLVLDEPLIQVDVWGGPKVMAEQGAQTIRAALSTRLPFTVSGKGILGGVTAFGGLRYIPDVTYDPARPRYVFDVSLVTRPLSAS